MIYKDVFLKCDYNESAPLDHLSSVSLNRTHKFYSTFYSTDDFTVKLFDIRTKLIFDIEYDANGSFTVSGMSIKPFLDKFLNRLYYLNRFCRINRLVYNISICYGFHFRTRQ